MNLVGRRRLVGGRPISHRPASADSTPSATGAVLPAGMSRTRAADADVVVALQAAVPIAFETLACPHLRSSWSEVSQAVARPPPTRHNAGHPARSKVPEPPPRRLSARRVAGTIGRGTSIAHSDRTTKASACHRRGFRSSWVRSCDPLPGTAMVQPSRWTPRSQRRPCWTPAVVIADRMNCGGRWRMVLLGIPKPRAAGSSPAGGT